MMNDFAKTQTEIARQLIIKVREAKAYEREDYKECLDLMEVYIGDNSRYNFLKPGAVHKARWMGKQLYCYKMVMLRKHLPMELISSTQLDKMQRVVTFLTHVYNIWWFQCPLATSAPRLDLELVKNLIQYRSIDEEVSSSALKSFRKHTWYLHAEMVPLALRDSELDYRQKQKLATKILHQPKDADDKSELQFVGRHGAGYGKPDLLAVNIDANELHELVTPASWRFFKILGFSSEFLESSPQQWASNEEYMKAGKVLRHFKVTNEDAERSVKLCADFLGASKKEELFQNYIQVVETERKQTPNIRMAIKQKSKE